MLIILFMPGFYYVLGLRFQHTVYRWPIVGRSVAKILWFVHSLVFGSEISQGVTIGAGFHTPHPYSIVIGHGTRIGRNVTILQGVTIGIRSTQDRGAAQIGDNVRINANAMVIGAVTIGDGATIGAGAVVLSDIPGGAVAVGNPARILQQGLQPAHPLQL